MNVLFSCKGGGSGGVQGPGWRCIKYKWKWKFEMESEINQGTEVTGAALVVINMTKAATLILFFFIFFCSLDSRRAQTCVLDFYVLR